MVCVHGVCTCVHLPRRGLVCSGVGRVRTRRGQAPRSAEPRGVPSAARAQGASAAAVLFPTLTDLQSRAAPLVGAAVTPRCPGFPVPALGERCEHPRLRVGPWAGVGTGRDWRTGGDTRCGGTGGGNRPGTETRGSPSAVSGRGWTLRLVLGHAEESVSSHTSEPLER